MSDYNLGTARGRIEIDASGAVAGGKKAEKAVDGFSAKAAKAGPGLVAAGGAVGLFGAVVAGGFALAVNSATDFEKRMSAIQAVSGATESELESLSKKALQLGADTSFSASEAAIAIEELVKAGVTVPEVMAGAADSVVALAAAGEIALPEAATIAANAMNGFNIAAKDMVGVADTIAGAANASAIDVGEFGMSMSQVSAVANLAGLSFEDTAVAIAEMGNAGIKGSDAGTSLKSMLSNLQPTTEKQVAAMKELGLMTKEGANQFYNAQGQLKPLSEIQKLLSDSTKDLTEQQKIMALETIFGSDAIRAAGVLANEGAAGYEKMSSAINATSAADVAAARLDNLAGSWEQLKGSLETLAITVGTYLLPAIKSFTDGLTKLVNWFTNLDESTQKTILVILGILAAVSVVLGIVLALAGGIGILLGALAPLAAVIGVTSAVLLGWIAVIVAVIAIVVILGVLIYKNWDKIKAWTISAWNAVKDWVIGVWDTIVAKVTDAINSVKDVITSVGNAIKGAWDAVWNAVKSAIMTVWGLIVGYVTFYINAIKLVITTVLAVIMGIWNAFWGLFGGLISAVWGLIVAAVQLGIALVMFYIRTVLMVIQGIWNMVWGNLVRGVTIAWNFIKNAIMVALNAIRAVVSSVMNFIGGIVSAVWSRITAATRAAWERIKSSIIAPIQAAAARVNAVVSGIRERIVSTFNAAKAGATAAFESLRSAAVGKIQALKDKVSGIVSSIKGIFSGAGNWLFSAGKDIIQGLIRGVTSMINSLTSKLKGITSLIPKNKGPERVDKKLLFKNGQWIMGGLEQGLEYEWKSVAKGLQAMTAEFPDLAVTQSFTSSSPKEAAIALASPASSAVSAPPKPPSDAPLRFISGTIGFDASGRAFIQGVAQEVLDNDKSFEGTHGRMSGF